MVFKNNENLPFQQIITIGSANSLNFVSKNQLIAISNTQAVIFQIDPNECDDIKHIFEPDSKQTQCKRLVGKNIDFKVDLDQTIS